MITVFSLTLLLLVVLLMLLCSPLAGIHRIIDKAAETAQGGCMPSPSPSTRTGTAAARWGCASTGTSGP